MAQQFKKICEKIILIIITISILISFCATPSAYAKLELQEGEFYYAGTQKGQYTVTEGIFSWLLEKIGDIADWILGIITMGFRMIFVGWTALFEKLLTWALESAAGVNLEGDLVESNTDLTSITDSSNNVTIEAIVYNHVPALDANMFRYEQTLEDLKYSGTGHVLRCEDKDCNTDPNDDVTKCCSEDGVCTCECGKGSRKCDSCMEYCYNVKKFLENQEASPEEREDSIIVQIKKSAAMWYYIIRAIALAAMLVLLVGVGIKMAISNIAEQKAVYKRMLVDWIIGMIILFSMHYIMVFVFYINEAFVNIIEETATDIYNVQMMQLAEKDSSEGVDYTDEELELKIYETIRTRAYDAKLLNGLTGTIMYMTLVFFAFKYTIVYVKRFFTIMVLTIISPAVGFGYAMQKTLTGRQAVMKTWLSEYILNTIIQVVHALTYSIFISQALVLSLNSIGGVIVALILMNFALKAEGVFRKIFKISGGLVDETNNAAESFKENLQSTIIGGKSTVKTLTNTPYMTAAKGIGKAALVAPAALVYGGKKLGNKLEKTRPGGYIKEKGTEAGNFIKEKGSNIADRFGRNENPRPQNESDNNQQSGGDASNSTPNPQPPIRTDEEIFSDGEERLEKNFYNAKKDMENAKTPEEKKQAFEKIKIAVGEYNRYKTATTPTNFEILKAHGKRIIGVDNVLSVKVSSNKKQYKEDLSKVNGHFKHVNRAKARYQYFKNRGIGADMFGHTYVDKRTGKKVNDGTGFYNKFRLQNLLGLTDKDKELMKKHLGTTAGVITGMASMFLGMGTIVANPKVGFGLLVSGNSLYRKGLGRSMHPRTYRGRYTFSHFSVPALKGMNDRILQMAQEEYNKMVTGNIRNNMPGLYNSLQTDTVKPRTLKGVFKMALTPGRILQATETRFVQNTRIGDQFGELNYHYAKQQKAQKKEFQQETAKLIADTLVVEMKENKKRLDKKNKESEEQFKVRYYAILGYRYDPITKVIEKINQTDPDEMVIEEFANKLDSRMRNNMVDDDISDYVKVKYQLPQGTEITKAEIDTINLEIDDILVSMSAGEVLDMNNEANLDTAMQELTARLYKKGIIARDQNASVLFVSGKVGLQSMIKEKAELVNIKVEVAAEALEDIDDEDKNLIKEVVKEIAQEEKIEDFTTVKVEDVIERINNRKTGRDETSAELDTESATKSASQEPPIINDTKTATKMSFEEFRKLYEKSSDQDFREIYRRLNVYIQNNNVDNQENNTDISSRDSLSGETSESPIDIQSKDKSEKGQTRRSRSVLPGRKRRIDQIEIEEKIEKGIRLSSEEMRDLYGKLNIDGLEDISQILGISSTDTSDVIDTSTHVENNGQRETLVSSNNDRASNNEALTEEQVREYTPKIAEFLVALEVSKVVTHTEEYHSRVRARERVNYETKNRKKKLQQILELTLDTDQEDPVSDLIDQVEALGSTGGNITDKDGNIIPITSDQSEGVLKMLFLTKELHEINRLGKEEAKMKKGTYSYTRAMHQKADKSVTFYQDNLRIVNFKNEHQELYNDSHYKSQTSKYTDKEIKEKDEILELERTLEKKRKEMEKAKREVEIRGPVVDMRDVHKKLFQDDE